MSKLHEITPGVCIQDRMGSDFGIDIYPGSVRGQTLELTFYPARDEWNDKTGGSTSPAFLFGPPQNIESRRVIWHSLYSVLLLLRHVTPSSHRVSIRCLLYDFPRERKKPVVKDDMDRQNILNTLQHFWITATWPSLSPVFCSNSRTAIVRSACVARWIQEQAHSPQLAAGSFNAANDIIQFGDLKFTWRFRHDDVKQQKNSL